MSHPLFADILGLPDTVFWVVAGVVLVVLVVCLWVFFSFVQLLIRSLFAGAHIGVLDMIRMKALKLDPALIVNQKIALAQAGVRATTQDLESYLLAALADKLDHRLERVVRAVIAAHKAGWDLPFNTAAAIQLAGRDILEAVQVSVTPKVIDCPPQPEASKWATAQDARKPDQGGSGRRNTLDGVTRNGIQLKAWARVTVRTKLDRLVGGAPEETIIARVGEGIVKAIGGVEDHTQVLANPHLISEAVLHNALDSQTAFEIVSIDIVEIDVGENIGAKLQINQAEADKQVAQANAEKRRAMAVALEQEMRAKVEEHRALVVLAEADVPKAIADAFRGGRIGVMDYYNLKNLQSDTRMRGAIAGGHDRVDQSLTG